VASGFRSSKYVLNESQQIFRNFIVYLQLGRVYNAHIHARLYAMIQESGMNGFTNNVIPRKENETLLTPPKFSPGEDASESRWPLKITKRLFRCSSMPVATGKDVRIKDDILGSETN
jgi:hypothetical protein